MVFFLFFQCLDQDDDCSPANDAYKRYLFFNKNVIEDW